MPQTPTLRRNHLEIFFTIKKIVKLYEQPWGPFLELLSGLVFCPGFQHQLWAWSNSNECTGSKKSLLWVLLQFQFLRFVFDNWRILHYKREFRGKNCVLKTLGKTPILPLFLSLILTSLLLEILFKKRTTEGLDHLSFVLICKRGNKFHYLWWW